MNIYLDIDGTLIHEDRTERYGKAAAGLNEFIVALRAHDVHWLTTHCTHGDPGPARTVLKAHVPASLHPDIDRIKPVVWSSKKTEAIDWEKPFLWFDNEIFAAEREELKRCREDQCAIEMNLLQNPRQLIEITEDLLMGGCF